MSINPDTALLGALLSGYTDIGKIDAIVQPDDFREPRDEMVYQAIIDTSNSGVRVDPITVREHISADALRTMNDVGGIVYLVTLQTECPNPLEAEAYAKQVHRNRQRRDLAICYEQGHDELLNLDRDPAEIADRSITMLTNAVAGRGSTTLTGLEDTLPDVVDIAERGQTTGLGTPWPDLNKLTSLAPGRFIVVGGRPGGGKSVMGGNLALHVAHKFGHGVVLCSIEMGREEVTQRMLASHARVNLSNLTNGTVSEREWEMMREKMDDLMNLPIAIDDSATQTLTSIRAAVKHAKQRRTVALVIVDYLQLMTARDPKANREAQVSEFARGLKLLSREQNVCVVAMAQLNREAGDHGRPTMAHLRESGGIEANADVVVLLHRPEIDGMDIDAIVAKNRQGPMGNVPMQLQGAYSRLVPAVNSSQGWSAA